MLWPHLARILELAQAQADHLPLRNLRQHVDELALDKLVARERARELLARLHVVERAMVAASRRAEGAPRDSVTRLRQAGEGPPQTACLRQMVVLAEAHVLEHQFRRYRRAHRELAVDIAGREPGRALLDDKAGYTLVDFGPHYRHIGDRAVGDPALGPIEHPAVAVAPRTRLHPARIRAMVGLGQPEASDKLALSHLGDVPLLLLLRAGRINRVHRERALDRGEGAQAGVGRLQFLHD